MAAARRKAIEREVRAKMLGQGRGRMPPVATDEEVRDALIKALVAHGLRHRAAGQAEGGADGGGDDAPAEA
jgi:hypothetical protein